MPDLALYGFFRNRPRWYVRWRGLHWLENGGYCPCCYSSPPLAECPICEGYNEYGSTMPRGKRVMWKMAWRARCDDAGL